jgi:16S rRNA (adenine1518-N6/adenine1519-N6)-dimethyltransferase
MRNSVRPKKHLGQHFLTDENMAKKIAASIKPSDDFLLEIGPGTGSLTKYLLPAWGERLGVIEIDKESIEYLKATYPELAGRVIDGDVLTYDVNAHFKGKPFNIIGNFPYNISTQILFKALEYRSQVKEVVGMFQKEVAKRICSPPGNKDYGILSVLIQAYFNATYLFDVPPTVFVPPPAVNSGVIRLTRKSNLKLDCNEELFVKVVKLGFNQRRKMLSNALSSLITNNDFKSKYLKLRAEQLSWQDFVELTHSLEEVA